MTTLFLSTARNFDIDSDIFCDAVGTDTFLHQSGAKFEGEIMTEIQRAPPRVVSLPISTAWNVMLPTVFRYENDEWIDAFFSTGALRLSTFAKFATYADEARGDNQEGRGVATAESTKGTFIVGWSEGQKAFVLCGSTVLNDDLKRDFSRDSVFAIEDTLTFSIEVARQLPGFRTVIEGHCIYRSDTVIRRKLMENPLEDRLPNGGVNMDALFRVGGEMNGPERLFLKRAKYQNQREYRLLWHVDGVDGDFIDIKVPNAIKACRRVSGGDY